MMLRIEYCVAVTKLALVPKLNEFYSAVRKFFKKRMSNYEGKAGYIPTSAAECFRKLKNMQL